jgi:diadenosine tetraphosphatase ApaH/serine/threonine PP2A family protein phosphatase
MEVSLKRIFFLVQTKNKFVLICFVGVGISPELESLDDIERIYRFRDVPETGLFCDLLWSDPIPTYQYEVDHAINAEFEPNVSRGCSYFYGLKGISDFLLANGLVCIIRGHEAQPEGREERDFPSHFSCFLRFVHLVFFLSFFFPFIFF